MGGALKRYQQYCLDVDYAAEWLEYAEYAVAELEAELAGTQLALNAITKGNMEACTQRNEAQAELAALKAITAHVGHEAWEEAVMNAREEASHD